jgi:hypothetical protein
MQRPSSLLTVSRRLFASKQYFPQMPQGQKIKRFYKKVDVIEHPLSEEGARLAPGEKVDFRNLSVTEGKYWAVTLDGKVTKTMYKDSLLIPSKAMAVALAEEWDSQQENISLKSLHLVSSLGPKMLAEQLPCEMRARCQRRQSAELHARGALHNTRE